MAHSDEPRFFAAVISYPENLDQARRTLADFAASDWGSEPAFFLQPPDWPKDKPSASANYRRALATAAADGCDFALILEDDVRVVRHLRHNLSTIPIVARRQSDYLSLFIPDLIFDPWEREEPHLGYRVARPRYEGPDARWEKYRLWGSQAYLLSRRLLLALLERWDSLDGGQDARVITVCNELKLPMYYTHPCLVEHVPAVTAFGTPIAYAPDFDSEFRLTLGAGFQPPETTPGWLTPNEAKCLFAHAVGRDVLELVADGGRATVCLAQAARSVTTRNRGDPALARRWVRRYGVEDRVAFARPDEGMEEAVLGGPFDFIFIDAEHDAVSLTRDIERSLVVLSSGGLLAFHDYPDPGWPEVRPTVDEFARKLNWKRIAQVDYCAVFRTA